MNILILTAKFGMGHYNVANAIKENTLEKSPDAKVTIIDYYEYFFPDFYKLIYGNFDFIVSKFSYLYGTINVLTKRGGELILNNGMLNKITKLFNTENPDLIISTFPICSKTISAYKEQKELNIPLYTYITDLTVTDDWLTKNNDLYFVGAEYTKTILITKGINPQQIIVSGIPVKKNFITKKEHKKSTNKTEILIMGGGLGIIPISSKILDRLVENKHIHLTIITGKNVRFKKYLEKNYPDINALGYVSNVYRYMRKSDMVITKPGGITTFEAINMGTPLYVFKPFLFQERDNAKYIEMQNIGKIIENEEDLISSVENEMLLNEMKKNMFEIKKNWNRNNALNYCKKESKR